MSALKLLSSLPARLPLVLGAQRKQLLLDRGATDAFFCFYALFSSWFSEAYLASPLWNRRCQVECTEAKARDDDSVEISLVVRGTQGISGIDFGVLKAELRSKARILGKAGQEPWWWFGTNKKIRRGGKEKNDLLEGKDLGNNVCSSLMTDDRCCLERSWRAEWAHCWVKGHFTRHPLGLAVQTLYVAFLTSPICLWILAFKRCIFKKEGVCGRMHTHAFEFRCLLKS